MLKNYNYIETPHHFLNDKLLAFFSRIEYENGEYSSSFFETNFYNNIVKHHPTILEAPLKSIFEVVKNWEQPKRSLFIQKIHESNNIEAICRRDIDPLKLDQLDTEILVAVDIKKLFSDLYKQVLYGANCKKAYGDMQEHFKLFKSDLNEIFKCPVCGLIPQNSKEEKKEDYDHLLPYTIYPFSAVNFRNLAPICVDCNSDYKKDKDVLDNSGKKIFYYYDESHKGIKIEAKLEIEDEYEFSFSFTTEDSREEEIESWNSIFCIKERYQNRAKGKASSWYRHYWEFLEDPTFKSVDLSIKKLMYTKNLERDPDCEVIKSPVILAMENSSLAHAFQEAASYSMNFD